MLGARTILGEGATTCRCCMLVADWTTDVRMIDTGAGVFITDVLVVVRLASDVTFI